MANFEILEQYLNDDSFVRWIIGKAEAEESQRWENWEKLDPAHSELASEARVIIKKLTADEPEYPNPKTELRHLHHLIDRYEEEKELWSFNRYEKRRTPVYIGIAASIAILIGLIYFYGSFTRTDSNTQDENKVASVQEFQTDYGQKSTLSLSDGSRIILNANSSLKFTSHPDQNGNIDIWLNGEAYFSIPHFTGLKKRVVRIHTRDGIITDLGTEFSVNSRSGMTLVALVEGHVRVKSNADSSNDNGSGDLLDPNDLAILHRGKEGMQVSHVSTSLYTSWITNKLVCDHTPLQQIIRRITNTYGVKVVVANPRLLNKTLSGSLDNDNLNVLKKALSNALKASVYQHGKIVYIDQSGKNGNG